MFLYDYFEIFIIYDYLDKFFQKQKWINSWEKLKMLKDSVICLWIASMQSCRRFAHIAWNKPKKLMIFLHRSRVNCINKKQ